MHTAELPTIPTVVRRIPLAETEDEQLCKLAQQNGESANSLIKRVLLEAINAAIPQAQNRASKT